MNSNAELDSPNASRSENITDKHKLQVDKDRSVPEVAGRPTVTNRVGMRPHDIHREHRGVYRGASER